MLFRAYLCVLIVALAVAAFIYFEHGAQAAQAFGDVFVIVCCVATTMFLALKTR